MFVATLWHLAHDPHFFNVIYWKNTTTVVIPDVKAPAFKVALSRYFKHSQLASLIRQLNMYKFFKMRIDHRRGLEITHPHFHRDNFDSLSLICRHPPPSKTILKKRVKMIKDLPVSMDGEDVPLPI